MQPCTPAGHGPASPSTSLAATRAHHRCTSVVTTREAPNRSRCAPCNQVKSSSRCAPRLALPPAPCGRHPPTRRTCHGAALRGSRLKRRPVHTHAAHVANRQFHIGHAAPPACPSRLPTQQRSVTHPSRPLSCPPPPLLLVVHCPPLRPYSASIPRQLHDRRGHGAMFRKRAMSARRWGPLESKFVEDTTSCMR